MIDILGILDVLPHRYPFLLVDRILEMDGERVLGLKNVTFNEPHFTGHFPGAPVMPGVLIVEAMAQAGAVMMLSGVPDRHSKLVYFTGIDKCRFRRPVVPGDQLLLEVRLVRRRSRFAVMHGIARVGGEVAAEAELSSAMVDRPQGGG
ncbi:MAG TPA: 3-hydroxyacyl-ACP dehydratase FabZ [Thermoanaerobaculaceae bacterium]|nr:3-hydroxyacyl-ACP dehydratase FabZ [Thermoanaerobaculaceae bacterium]HPS78800.1 3-hydroxyacyl-ACP dehydratase FabZ [Thermoanaerobaculaceae bacterium]